MRLSEKFKLNYRLCLDLLLFYFLDLDLSHADNYTCVAENPHGSDSVTWRVVVLRPPAPPTLALIEARPRELELELRPALRAPGHALPKAFAIHWRLATPEVSFIMVFLNLMLFFFHCFYA